MDLKSLNEFALQFSQSLPPLFHDLKSEFAEYLRLGIEGAIQKFDWVSREELETQMVVLEKLRHQVDDLMQKVAILEKQCLTSTK